MNILGLSLAHIHNTFLTFFPIDTESMRVQEEKKRNKLEIISQYRKLIEVGGQHLLEWELLCSSSMLTIFFDPKLEL